MVGLVVSGQYGKITVLNIGKYTMNDTGVNQKVLKSLCRGGRPQIRATQAAKKIKTLQYPMDNNQTQTEFNGNVSCLMRHHKHIETFYLARSESYIAGMYTELMNIVSDIIPEMNDEEYKEWCEIKSRLNSNFLTYKNTQKSIMVDKHMRNVIASNFNVLVCDNFEKYMRMSKVKGMLQRNSNSFKSGLL